MVHKAVQGGLVLRRGGLHRVRRGVLWRGWREREQVLTGGRLTALQLTLFGFLRVLGTTEGTAPAAAGRERFRGLVEPGQRAGKVRPAHLGRQVRGHPGGCGEEREGREVSERKVFDSMILAFLILTHLDLRGHTHYIILRIID